jgi:uridine kinase
MRDAPVILGIAGGSGSGKTYLARRIQQAAGPEQVAVLSMDQYFCSLTDAERQLDPRDINFDHPSHIDFQRLADDLQALRAGQRILAPSYDFRTQIQTPGSIPVEPARVIVVEGLFILGEPLVGLFDLTVFLEVDADQRLIGRLLRDLDERDADIHWNIDRYQRFVRPGYETFVKPTLLAADVVVDFTYRRRLFQELLVAAVRGYVVHGSDLRSLIDSVRSDGYKPGLMTSRDPARLSAAPPRAEAAPAALPTLWVADNRQSGEPRE